MQTEDQLTRDMLAATASFINCVGGVNGRIIAVKKFSLIDLESQKWVTRGKRKQPERLSEKPTKVDAIV